MTSVLTPVYLGGGGGGGGARWKKEAQNRQTKMHVTIFNVLVQKIKFNQIRPCNMN